MSASPDHASEFGTLTADEARARAHDWIAAWNSHDVDAIMAHYTDDFTMSSPYIPLVTGEKSGTLHGQAAVRRYWTKALELRPALHFELIEVLVGANSIALYYRSNVSDKTVVEVLTLAEDGRYSSGSAHNAV